MSKIFVIVCLIVSSIFAIADGPDFYAIKGIAVGHHLNLREKPTTKSEPVAYIPHDAECLKNLGCKGGVSLRDFEKLTKKEIEIKLKNSKRWCKIEYKSKIGWVYGKFLEEKSCSKYKDRN